MDYKIIANYFQNRLKAILPFIIHPDQKDYFVKGRNINEANCFIYDLITYLDIENKEGTVIFLDQIKSFDRVEWRWVDMCLTKFGIGENLGTGSICYNCKLCIQTNSFVSECFAFLRSIKQGCPIRPLLHIIQAEPMGSSIRKKKHT